MKSPRNIEQHSYRVLKSGTLPWLSSVTLNENTAHEEGNGTEEVWSIDIWNHIYPLSYS